MAQQILRSEKAEAYVGRPRPFLQEGRVEVVLRRGPIVQNRDGNLTAFERNHLRVLGGADHAVVTCDRRVAVYTEVRHAITGGIREVLPG